MYSKFYKRIIDVTVSIVGLVIFIVPIIFIYIGVKIDSIGPAIFVQKRLGKDQKVFTIYKFRTMVPDACAIGSTDLYYDDKRITRFGAKLRRMSLDELPQLLNVIKGDMAIIGPRPILQDEFVGFCNNETYMSRFKVLPGMFCSVDLNFRALATRDLQFQMDADYVKDIKFSTDIKLFFGIIKTVIKGINVYKDRNTSLD